MSSDGRKRSVSSAARVYSRLHADDALLPGEVSALRRSAALFLALMVLSTVPLFLAANAAGLATEAPTADTSRHGRLRTASMALTEAS